MQNDQANQQKTLDQKLMHACQDHDLITARSVAKEILTSQPENALAHYQLGITEYEVGDIEKGAGLLKKAIALRPHNHQFLHGLGHYQRRNGQYEFAIDSLQKALYLKPDFAFAHAEIGHCFAEQNLWAKAFEAYAHAIFYEPHNVRFKEFFIQTLPHCTISNFEDHLCQILIYCLEDEHIQHRPLAPICKQYVNTAENLAPIMALAKISNLDTIENINYLLKATQNQLFRYILRRLFLTDPNFEKALTNLRYWLLNYVLDTQKIDELNHKAIKNLAYDLAIHCWYNEYVFFENADEHAKIQDLRAKIESAEIDHDTFDPLQFFILGCYQPLYQLKNASEIIELYKESADDELRTLLTLQIENPLEEHKIRQSLQKNTVQRFTDNVSQAVQAQYEEHPYPRWQFVDRTVTNPEAGKDMNILVAGCGTGQQSASVAITLPNAQIHNIDLSTTSLAYAIRQCEALGLENLTFEHQDILEFSSDIQYDRIYCGGVLHHMKDPEAGLAKLIEYLKPKGIIALAVYSEAARQDIVEGITYIKAHGFEATNDGIRAFRHALLHGEIKDNTALDNLLNRSDFYNLSMCRDLLFHVQEHRYTIPQLEGVLNKYKLSFLGFTFDRPQVMAAFQKEFPEKDAAFNIRNWHEFEQKHPSAFKNMYQLVLCHSDSFDHHKNKSQAA